MKKSTTTSPLFSLLTRFAPSIRVGFVSSAAIIFAISMAPAHATTLLTDSYLNPNAPSAGAELNDNLVNRQTGSLATVGYSSNTANSGGSNGFAYLNENSQMEILANTNATFSNVWTTTGFSTSAQTTVSVDLWPTVTQNGGSGFASLLVGGALANTQANDGVLFGGAAANAITVTLYGNGALVIQDQSKFDGLDSQYIFFSAPNYFSNTGFQTLSIVTSAFTSGSQTLSFYLNSTPVLTNYTRTDGFTSDNYIGFQAYRNTGATQSVFDNLSVTVVPEPSTFASLALVALVMALIRGGRRVRNRVRTS